LGFEPRLTAVFNIAFISIGVVSGILLGLKFNDQKYFRVVLSTLFIVCTVALAGLAVFVLSGLAPPQRSVQFAVILPLAIISGGASLGFIGIGIEASALYPTSGTYVCFAIELVVQVVGAVLNEVASDAIGFVAIVAVSCVATCLLLFSYHPGLSSGRSF